MKRLILLILCIAMAVSLLACAPKTSIQSAQIKGDVDYFSYLDISVWTTDDGKVVGSITNNYSEDLYVAFELFIYKDGVGLDTYPVVVESIGSGKTKHFGTDFKATDFDSYEVYVALIMPIKR